jgi:Fic/DOC family protein
MCEAALSAQVEGAQATLLDLFDVEGSDDASREAEVEEICAPISMR